MCRACRHPLAWSRLSRRVSLVPRRPQPRSIPAAATTESHYAAQVQQLEDEFGIPDFIEVKEGRGGLPTLVLTHACGSCAEVALFGACVTSWQVPSGRQMLLVRPDSAFDKSKPIAGGIPIVFPQFGPGPMQQHGFARCMDWQLAASSIDGGCGDNRHPEVQLVLEDSEATRAMWPHSFRATYTVLLQYERLVTELHIQNTGGSPFSFTAALHSYFAVPDVEQAAVRMLEGLEYLDKVADPSSPPRRREDREAVTISGPTDAVYLGAGDSVQLDICPGLSVNIASSSGWSDVVVWNPWTAMPDSYRSFLCVENACVGSPVTLQPGGSWRAQTEMAAEGKA